MINVTPSLTSFGADLDAAIGRRVRSGDFEGLDPRLLAAASPGEPARIRPESSRFASAAIVFPPPPSLD